MPGPSPNLHAINVPEWDAEDLLSGTLAEAVTYVELVEAQAMLEGINVKLPHEILQQQLPPLTPGDAQLYDFYAVQVPLNILVPDGQRISRLRLSLDLLTDGGASKNAVAYDLFPPDEWEVKEVAPAEIKLDVSKLLTFAYPALADCLGLKFDIPIKWHTQKIRIRTSDRMANPVEWYVTDKSVQHGFSGAVIIRAQKSADVQVRASMVGELRKSGPLGWFGARFRTDDRTYPIRRAVA